MKKDMLFGVHSVGEWLRADATRITELFFADRPNERVQKLIARAREAGIPVTLVGGREMKDWAGPRNSQGVGATVTDFPFADLDEVLFQVEGDPLLVIADGVTDPANLGGILRSAAFFGVTALLIPRDRSAAISPVVERTSAGGAAQVPICQVNSLLKTVKTLQKRNIRVVASVLGPHPHPAEADLRGPIALMVGSEGKGLRPSLRKAADLKTSIPADGLGSLNVAGFTSVLLYETARQRKF